MKTNLRNFISSIIFVFSAFNSFSQDSEILSDFSVFESNGRTYLNWTILSGSTCNGIQILHSSNGLSFQEIGEIPGICGSSTDPVDYSFVDVSPVSNGINYYKLQLGLSGYSNVISIQLIELNDEGYVISPNPIQSEAKLFFNNPKNSLSKLNIYNLNGALVATINTTAEFFSIKNEGNFSGQYYFEILQNDISRIKGKLLFVKRL